MKIVIAGGTGFLGRALAGLLAGDRHEVVVLTRTPRAANHVPWIPDGGTGPWARTLDGAGAVINLAGDSIAAGRWTDDRKRRLVESRLRATRSLLSAMRGLESPPAVFLSSSATGYYGPRGDEPVTEATPAGSDFLATLCVQWEQAALDGGSAATRVVLLRTGLVLAKDGGALAKLLLPFRFGAGGPMGSGRQYMPWIHRADWLALVRWLLLMPLVTGAFNGTAPHPVTNREFASTLGRLLRRPAVIAAPAFALRLALGEMAEPLLLSGQRVIPARALELGFHFRFPTLEEALADILSGGGAHRPGVRL